MVLLNIVYMAIIYIMTDGELVRSVGGDISQNFKS